MNKFRSTYSFSYFQVSINAITLNTKFFILILGVFSQLPTFAQYIKQTGEIVDEVDGNPLFTLEDRTFVYSEKSEALWFHISKKVAFKMSDLSADSTLSHGAILYDQDLEEIGRVKSEVKVIQVTGMNGIRRSDYRWGIVKGYCSTFDTYTNSRPEDAITDALEGRGQHAQLLSEVMANYPWESDNSSNYSISVLRNEDENNFNENPPYRIILVWRGSTLMAIISPKEYIRGNKSKSESKIVEDTQFATWFQRPNDRLIAEIESIVFNYLQFDEPGMAQ